MATISSKTFKSKSGKDITIRNAHSKDAQRLIDINTAIVGESLYMMREPEELNYTLNGEISRINNFNESEGSLYLVAETGGTVAGYIDFQNGFLRRTSHAGNFSIFIDKNYREEGIGKMLLQTLIEWAEQNPLIEKITLAVFSTNERAQGLYRKLGFIVEGNCPKDMKLKDGSYMDSVLMYKFVK